MLSVATAAKWDILRMFAAPKYKRKSDYLKECADYVQREENYCSFICLPLETSLLGMNVIDALKIGIRGSQLVAPIASHLRSPEVMIKLENFQHEVKLKQNVQPLKQKLRRLPLSVRSEVSKEIHRLLDEGIIEPFNASSWISPVVVVRKKNGGIRLCVGLREPNKAVVADSYPLPNIEDLLLNLKGAPFFSALVYLSPNDLIGWIRCQLQGDDWLQSDGCARLVPYFQP
uniref:Reverse transcriptase domain-containing protein n=1 Tax=Trichuris muris TaxID=70415 RepID=A0A5S6R6E7_TRIMR